MIKDNSTRGSREMCGRSCKHWAFDMDGEFCIHPKSYKIAPACGASVNRMSLEGHCRGGYDDISKNTRKLYEAVNND